MKPGGVYLENVESHLVALNFTNPPRVGDEESHSSMILELKPGESFDPRGDFDDFKNGIVDIFDASSQQETLASAFRTIHFGATLFWQQQPRPWHPVSGLG
jgi:hypothetical protein